MKLRTLLIINAVIALVFAAGFLLIPATISEQYGVESSAAMEYTDRLFGAALLGYAVLAWLARNADESTARRAIVWAFLIGSLAGTIVSLIGQINNVVNALGWSTVAIYALLTIGYVYFQFLQPAPKEVPRVAQ